MTDWSVDGLGNWPLLPWFGGAVLGWMLATLIVSWRANVTARQAYGLGQQASADAFTTETEQLTAELLAAHNSLELVRGRLEYLQDSQRTLERRAANAEDTLHQAQADLAASNARLEAAQQSLVTQRDTLVKTGDQLKEEFQSVAQQLFSNLFTQQGQAQEQQLGSLLKPFREQLGDFRRRVDEVYQTDTKERASLLTQMKNLHQASERINTEAANLTTALKGDKKQQGNWGEMVLERVLESSGLRANQDYLLQPPRRNEEGDLKRPDVIVQLPQGKQIIVDAKTSLNAYELAIAATDDKDRHTHLAVHCQNLQQHAKRLAEQDYSDLVDVNSLDFVLMFVPIESALTTALEANPRLFTDAFDARVVIVSPSTLMLCLRIVHNLWRFENQDRNAQEIASRAGQLYDKLRGLVEDVDNLERQLLNVDRTFAGLKGKLTSGKGNLVRQAEQLRALGAPVKRTFPDQVLDAAREEDEMVVPEPKDSAGRLDSDKTA